MTDSGQLQKMRITAYKKPTYSESEKIQEGEYVVKVNPEAYALNYEIKYGENQAPGTSNKLPKYNKSKPLVLEFEFIFDCTGVLPGTTDEERSNGIEGELAKFKKSVFSYDGEIHRPPFVMLTWGTLLFKCVLTSMNINYKLFRPDGKPIRAVVKAKFQGLIEENLRLAEENNSSPDLTHVRIVKDGDTLPLLCKSIYGNVKYYLEVARFNKLVNFRKLEAGQRIEFPPVQKS